MKFYYEKAFSETSKNSVLTETLKLYSLVEKYNNTERYRVVRINNMATQTEQKVMQ